MSIPLATRSLLCASKVQVISALPAADTCASGGVVLVSVSLFKFITVDRSELVRPLHKHSKKMIVKQTDWKNKPMTDRAGKIDFTLTFDNSEFEKIEQGHRPTDMDDRWFIYSDNNWTYFHRSWSGQCIFKLRFESANSNSYTIKECWVERDEKIYTIKDDKENSELIEQLIKEKLLSRT